MRCTRAVDARVISANPGVGAIPATSADRLAIETGLRFWRLTRFPYLIFYVEREDVDIWRVLHEQRDIPQNRFWKCRLA